ncbi:unnamed protein product [Spodoptera littoralis]|uniref:Uncharacterized protein n=1 Tax=Spodoptera littoralis TaxID=7109 RepID=A0A9P0I9W9_SPOLI|nr:unnamed protein product [Spodoptera littoralis]CAH1641425.1 unnamed protein product [Spodoptera littoralis]
MTSRRIEDAHQEILNKLLSESGLECFRSLVQSPESLSISEAAEEDHGEEISPIPIESAPEEQPKVVVEEEVPEVQPEIFPSASLRFPLPDKVRALEKHNRIHVLPDELKTSIDPQAIPKINTTPPQKCIDILGELLGCKRYKNSLAEFWFLDTVANLLRRAQEDEMDRPTQAILMIWFCEWMREMQYFDAADRKRMMRRFQENMLAAAKFLSHTDHIPTPYHAGITYKSPEDEVKEGHTAAKLDSKHNVHFAGSNFECSLRDLVKIIHYIFDLFSTDYQYNLVRSVFTFTPDYVQIDGPYQIQVPKRLYIPVKVKAKKPEKSPKKDAKVVKAKKKEDTEEYLALMELKAREEKLLEEQEELDKEMWLLKSSILPLSFAATDEFFNTYWPPPPPASEPDTSLDAGKSKGKGKGKK